MTWADECEWRKDAACARVGNPEAWEVDTGKGVPAWSMSDDNRVAIRICGTCPVLRACAVWALRAESWPAGVILAGVPVRRGRGGLPSQWSLDRLHAVAGEAA